MSKRPLRPEEKRAWARIARTVKARPGNIPPEMPPLDAIAAHPTDAKPQSTPPQHPSFGPLLAKLSTETKSAKSTAPVQNRGRERKVRRGQADIAAVLDLHGYTQAHAETALVSFLTRQQSTNANCVLVITGKGRAGEGVLRRQLLHWLGTETARHFVSGYAEAHRKHGGSGAWYLFLRKRG